MAETRKFDPAEGDDLARLVRDAMGETIRPNEPGTPWAVVGTTDDEDDDAPSLVDLPDLDF
ncbi:MAG: hypothetical protein GX596_02285 [Propionibacterium sp.]|nr:hypothetical protein [Propionibacterium sp.]